MRRVLVPLDGTALAASILVDARRLAGSDGEVILIRDTGPSPHGAPLGIESGPAEMEEASGYLQDVAGVLSRDGVQTETHALAIVDPAHAIDVAAQIYDADLVACATHGRGPLGRLIRGGVAWRALASSTVPVLLRRFDQHARAESIFASPRTIMVPLDGSAYAETALPLATELAEEWNARLLLVEVIPTLQPVRAPLDAFGVPPAEYGTEQEAATSYLHGFAETIHRPIVTRTLFGSVIEELVACAREEKVTDVVLASHGRTGLSRVLLGSVADDLIHRLNLPVIVVPSLVARKAPERAEAGDLHLIQQ